MSNQTSYNNKATSAVVYFNQYLEGNASTGDCCFVVVKSITDLSNISNPEVNNIAVIWDAEGNPNASPSIAMYLSNGNWAVKTLKGDKGDQGIQGLVGNDGKDGLNGADGRDGLDGVDGHSPTHRWVGTQLQFSLPSGGWGVLVDLKGTQGQQGQSGVNGAKGDKPNHQWDGTKLRFERPDNTWGIYVDLRGEKGEKGEKGDTGDQGIQGIQGPRGYAPEHEIDIVENRLRFKNPNGSWGDWINFSASTVVGNNGIIEITIYSDITDGNDVSQLVQGLNYSLVVPSGSLLHITSVVKTNISNVNYPEYKRTPVHIGKWWYKGVGPKTFGIGAIDYISVADFLLYYTNGNFFNNGLMDNSLRLLTSSIPLDDCGEFYRGMAYCSVSSDSNNFSDTHIGNLRDYLISTERLVIKSLFDNIKLDFSWGAIGLADNTLKNHIESSFPTLANKPSYYHGCYTKDMGVNNSFMLIRNLVINIPDYPKISGKSPRLVIDRYKPAKFKKSKGYLPSEYPIYGASNGYKSARRNSNKRLREDDIDSPIVVIPINSGRMVLNGENFKPIGYFKVFNSKYKLDENIEYIDDFDFYARGINKKRGRFNMSRISTNSILASVKLRFRIEYVNTDNRGRNKLFRTKGNGYIYTNIIRGNSLINESTGGLKTRILTFRSLGKQ